MNDYGLLAPAIAKLESMTIEDATQAQSEWMKANPGIRPDGPAFQWTAWNEDLPRLQQRYEQGDLRAVLQAVGVCAQHDLPLPSWCRHAYLRSWRKAKSYKCRTLDEAFGYELKGTNLTRARERYEMSLLVAIEIARKLAEGAKVEEAIEDIADRRAISFSRAREWYYELRHHPAVSAYFPANKENPQKD